MWDRSQNFSNKLDTKNSQNWYNDIGAKPLVLSKNGILIKYAFKCIKIREGVCIHGKLVFVKLSVNK